MLITTTLIATKLKRIFLFGLLFLFTATFSFASGKSEKKEGEPIRITDLAGRQVLVNVPVERIILQSSGSGGAFYTLLALDGKEVAGKIVGWDYGLRMYRQWIWQKFSEAVPELKEIPDVGYVYKGNFNVEKVNIPQARCGYSSSLRLQQGKGPFFKIGRRGHSRCCD